MVNASDGGTTSTISARQLLLAPPFLIVTGATFAFWMTVFAHSPLLPLYLAEIGYSGSVIGVVFGSAALAALLTRVATGWMIDRYGERPFLLVGALLWVVTAPVIPMSDSLAIIVVVWLLKGAGLALFTTASAGWASKYGPDRLRGQTMSYWGAANFLAAVLSPALAVWLAILAFATSTPLVLTACVLVGVGVGSTVPALTAWTANRVVQARRAVASGTFWTIYEIGLFGGSALMGLLFAVVRYSGFVVLAGVIAVIAIGYGLGWRAPRAQELAEGRPG